MRQVFEPSPISKKFLQVTVEELALCSDDAQDLVMTQWLICRRTNRATVGMEGISILRWEAKQRERGVPR